MKRALLCCALAFVACSHSNDSSNGADAPQTLDAFIVEQMDVAKIPGMSAAIVKNGKVVYTGAWGLADLEAKLPVKTDTIFLVASISKTVTAVAAMQLVEQGKIDLDADVNTYLPFSVRNPNFPDVPITPRMLLSHSSSIAEDYIGLFLLIGPGDSKVSLLDFVQSYVVPGGAHYATRQWSEKKPGTTYAYSQVGTSIIALLVERISGKPFDQCCNENIIGRLAMHDTSWRFAEVDASRVAVPYTFISGSGYKPNDHWGAPFYPAATIHTTAPELAKFLGSIAQHDGVLLKPETETEMLRVQFPDSDANEGLLWQHRVIGGFDTVGHGGGAPGVSSTMYFRQSDGVGVITLTNSDVHIRVDLSRDEQNAAYIAIEQRLWDEAQKY